MKKVTPELLQRQIEIAFILEPILDKDGCTTRYIDLPAKPLSHFLIAGVNVGQTFREYAESILYDGNNEIFSHLLKAMEVSNEYKSKKNINFGLLVFMFVAVQGRTKYDDLQVCLEKIPEIIKNTSAKDVNNYLEGFKINSRTSSGERKKQIVSDGYENFYEAKDLYELFSIGLEVFQDTKTSNHQFCREFVDGFPTVKEFISGIDEKKGLLESLANSYNSLHSKKPELSPGLLADLTATALFLYIAYKNPKEYSIV